VKFSASGSFVVDHETEKVLCVNSINTSGIGFPLGKLNEGESPMVGAVRETFEETGHAIYVDSITKAFTHFVGEHTNQVFLAQSIAKGKSLEDNVVTLWLTPEELIKSSFPKYLDFNYRCLKHFADQGVIILDDKFDELYKFIVDKHRHFDKLESK